MSRYTHKVMAILYASGSLLLLPFLTFATNHEGTGLGQGNSPCEGGNVLCNPLKAGSITEFLVNILDILLTLALPIIVLYIIYGGFKLVTAQGEPGKISDGRKAIMWAVIGGVVVLASKLILEIIQNTVSAL